MFRIIEKYYIFSIKIALFLVLFYFIWVSNSFLYTSILDFKNIKSDTFDWAVYPIEFVPNFGLLSKDERHTSFEDFPINKLHKIPKYNTKILSRNIDNLNPGDFDYEETIFQRFVYTVVYMWTYNYDYIEYTGSHPWVDIAALEWTPVKSIANWVVVKTGFQSAWFWNYVVIRHDNILLDSWSTWTIYSTYAHLSDILIKPWKKVSKWKIIWLVWNTGISFWSHLHFQIELESAPYHPYWHFTWEEAKKAWYSFYEAINNWLWKENAIANTINPTEFVNNNLSFDKKLVNNENDDDKKSTEILVINDNKQKKEEAESKENLLIEKKENIIESKEIKEIEIKEIKKENPIVVSTKKLALVSSEYDDIIIWDSSSIVSLLDKNPEDNFDIIDDEEKEDLVYSNKKEESYKKKDISNLDDKKDSDIENNNSIVNTQKEDNIDVETIVKKINESNLESKDSDNKKIDIISTEKQETKDIVIDNYVFKDIYKNSKYFLSTSYFKEKWIINWYNDWTFWADLDISRIEALKVILLSFWEEKKNSSISYFYDISSNSWENWYIISWKNAWLVSLKNKRFYPERNLSKVEALKMIFKLSWIDKDKYNDIELSFSDVKKSDWFYPYVAYLSEISGKTDLKWNFYPNDSISRGDLVNLIYLILKKENKL